jgi:hypothetical protein
MKIFSKNIFIFLIIGLSIYFISSCNKEEIVNNGTINGIVITNHDILYTDELGRILGGDYSDWCIHKAVDTFTYISSFSVTPISDSIAKIGYKSTKQYHCFGFDIERSLKTDTIYSKIGFIAGAGTTNDTIYYFYYDSARANVSNYIYRLKAIDIYGSFKYWYTINNITPNNSNYLFGPAYPNPASSIFKIQFSIPRIDTVSIYFINLSDSVFIMKNEKLQPGIYELDIHNSFNYHKVQKRLYIKCHSLPQSDSCRNYGDIQFN